MLSTSVQNGTLNDTAVGMTASQTAATVQDWFSQFGTAQFNLRMDSRLSLKDSSADVLVPLLNGESNIFFTQVGLRDNDGYFTTNLGFGHRHLFSEWMLGANLFWDATWNNVNHRYGAGLEAWRDFLKLSANGYRGISGWHQSRQHEDYNERPADGWDVRGETWLPQYPQLGGKLMFEQYYGNEVALLSWNDRQKDPYAITVGASYTPVPLVTAGIDLKNGKSGKNDTQIMLALNYQPGVPWQKQVNPDEVAIMRSLAGSRLDLVSRNNNVVLDYRKQEMISLGFPAQVQGTELTEYSFSPVIKSKHGVSRIGLDDTALVAAGGKVISASATTIRLQLPAYANNAVRLSGVAYDKKGNRSNLAETLITTASARHILTLTADKNVAKADGTDTATLVFHVEDIVGNALVGEEVIFSTDGGQLSARRGTTDSNGNISVTLSSLSAGKFHVTAIDGNQSITHEGVTFEAVLSGRILVNKTTAEANGSDAVTYSVSLEDAAGVPVTGHDINWNTTLGTLSATSGTTDASGQLSITLISTQSGQSVVKATTGDLTLTADTVTFTEQAITQSIETSKTQAQADGQDTVTYTVTVKKADGTAVTGQTVTWSSDLGTLDTTSTVTDNNGKTTVSLTSQEAGDAIVQARIGEMSLIAPAVAFNAVLNASLTTDKSTAAADGVTSVTWTTTVKDAAGKAVIGQTVIWSADIGSLAQASSVTDSNGEATITQTSTQSGVATVSATVGGLSPVSGTVSFEAVIASVSLDADATTAETGSTVHLTASVVDHAGEPIKNQWVTLTTSGGTLNVARIMTDSNGQGTFTLSSATAITATVTATAGSVSDTANVTFEQVTLAVSASAVDSSGGNTNGIVFGGKSPTYAWAGSQLKLEVTGATGDVSWSSSSSAASVSGNIVTINEKAVSVTLTGTDTAGHTVTYTLNTTGWVKYLSTDKAAFGVAQTTCSSYGGGIMSKAVMQSVYDEWGNLYAYNGWIRQYYMTSTAFTGSVAAANNNYAFWGETGLWVKNSWATTAFACY
ncbi:inverse autotransporter beta domain-containing protein [Enterobacter ludwigii]|uniref:inverse autotransporter beta domain-containing protein n=1 Tax=Enterobacter ludwigii TaxID=299767 RepID=UPI003974AA7B